MSQGVLNLQRQKKQKGVHSHQEGRGKALKSCLPNASKHQQKKKHNGEVSMLPSHLNKQEETRLLVVV